MSSAARSSVVSVIVDASVGKRISGVQRGRLRRRLGRMVRAAGLEEGSEVALEVAVRIIDDDTMRELNRDYRGKNRPTDVLAFPQREGEGAALNPEILGDIVVSAPTAARQAKRGLYREILHLCAHGLCHLLGHDHATAAEDAVMKARVRALLAEAERKGPTRPV